MGELKRQLPKQFKVTSYNVRTKPGQTQARLYGVAHFPTTVLLDRHGNVQQRIVGLISTAELRREVEAVIALP